MKPMNEVIVHEISLAMDDMGVRHDTLGVKVSRVSHWLDHIAQVAYREGRNDALMGIMTAEDVAAHYNISPRRARALIRNRHERFGVGMKAGNVWLINRDELHDLEPDARYRAGPLVKMTPALREFIARALAEHQPVCIEPDGHVHYVADRTIETDGTIIDQEQFDWYESHGWPAEL